MATQTEQVSIALIYDEIAEIFTSSPAIEQIASFRLSDEADQFIGDLLEANRTRKLRDDEEEALDHFEAIENLMQIVKITAHAKLESKK